MKKVDYEIIGYAVEFKNLDSYRWRNNYFKAEEEAIKFIKENRNKWSDYRMTKEQYAIIDF